MTDKLRGPGVYIEELPSGSHTIMGVSTSVTAFLGRAPIGPTDEPRTVFNFGEFQRVYGGLSYDHPMSYAVSDFFSNGGDQAVIARLAAGGSAASAGIGEPPKAEPASVKNSGKVEQAASRGAAGAKTEKAKKKPRLRLTAASEGVWGNQLTVSIDRDGLVKDGHPTEGAQVLAKQCGVDPEDFFNVEVIYREKGSARVSERYVGVCCTTGAASTNRLDVVLARQSELIRVAADDEDKPMMPPEPPPDVQDLKLQGGTDGNGLEAANYLGDEGLKTGMYLLDKAEGFNILCIPPDSRVAGQRDVPVSVWSAAAAYCLRRRAMLLVDPPESWEEKAKQGRWAEIDPSDLGIAGDARRNAAVYFPRVVKEDPRNEDQLDTFVASGMIAGIYAATDSSRGVWKAPAGADAGLSGIVSLAIKLTDAENGELNPRGINGLRSFPVVGPVVWGARTLAGADVFGDEYKYVPVRRLMLFIEASLERGTRWAVFEPNGEALWSALRLQVGGFLGGLAREGALYDYAVACDATTTTQADIDAGVVNIVVQFAPVRPAEFVVIRIQQRLEDATVRED